MRTRCLSHPKLRLLRARGVELAAMHRRSTSSWRVAIYLQGSEAENDCIGGS